MKIFLGKKGLIIIGMIAVIAATSLVTLGLIYAKTQPPQSPATASQNNH